VVLKKFQHLKNTKMERVKTIEVEVNLLDGKAEEGTKVSGKFFRLWMDVKAALTGHNRKAILKSCEYGEDRAKEAYDKVLENDKEHLSPALFTLIYS
jgi:uncharacterized protein (TIGR02284 family)